MNRFGFVIEILNTLQTHYKISQLIVYVLWKKIEIRFVGTQTAQTLILNMDTCKYKLVYIKDSS